MADPPSSNLLSRRVARARLGIGETLFKQLARADEFGPFASLPRTPGGHRRYPADRVEAYRRRMDTGDWSHDEDRESA